MNALLTALETQANLYSISEVPITCMLAKKNRIYFYIWNSAWLLSTIFLYNRKVKYCINQHYMMLLVSLCLSAFSKVLVCVSQPCMIVWIGYILYESAFDAAACVWHFFFCLFVFLPFSMVFVCVSLLSIILWDTFEP